MDMILLLEFQKNCIEIYKGIKNHLQKDYAKTIVKRYIDYSNRYFDAYDNNYGKKFIVKIK